MLKYRDDFDLCLKEWCFLVFSRQIHALRRESAPSLISYFTTTSIANVRTVPVYCTTVVVSVLTGDVSTRLR
jgi:hypothetical protein